MSKIIVISNQKGGAGKTTISMQLAGGLAKEHKKVLVVDADPQNTAMRWCTTAPDDTPFPAQVVSLSAAGNKIHRELKNFIGSHDFILVDCPPAADSEIAQSSLLVADLCIVPVIPSPPDLWSSIAIRETINKSLVINEDLQTRILINQFQPSLSMTKEILPLLEHFEWPIFETRLGLKTAYKESSALGGTVFSLGAKAKQAIQEVQRLTKEVLNIL